MTITDDALIELTVDPQPSAGIRLDVFLAREVEDLSRSRIQKLIEDEDIPSIKDWVAQCQAWKTQYPLKYKDQGDDILQQYAIEEMWRQTKDMNAYVAVGVGQQRHVPCAGRVRADGVDSEPAGRYARDPDRLQYRQGEPAVDAAVASAGVIRKPTL